MWVIFGIATESTESTEEMMLLEEDLTYSIRGAVYEVYQHLGHGYLEKVYERALVTELGQLGLDARPQVHSSCDTRTLL